MLRVPVAADPGGTTTTPLTEAFKGIATDGNLVSDLYPVYSTSVRTAPVRAAAESLLASLTTAQRAATWHKSQRPDRGAARRCHSVCMARLRDSGFGVRS